MYQIIVQDTCISSDFTIIKNIYSPLALNFKTLIINVPELDLRF